AAADRVAMALPRANFSDPLLQERNRLRTTYFKKNLVQPLTLAGLIASLALAFLSPYVVPLGWVVVIIAALAFADRRAKEEWWVLLLRHLGLQPVLTTETAPVTPLLRSGDEREVLRAATDGRRELLIFRSTDVTRDKNGNKQRSHNDFTVVVSRTPAPTVRFLSAHEHRFSRLKFLGDELRGKTLRGVEEFKVESVELGNRFSLRTSGEDATRARQLFKPSFIVWFARSGVPFEFEDGNLVVFVDRVLEHAEEFKIFLARAAEIEAALTGQPSPSAAPRVS
ncbi:MAG: hypothetical protein Q7T55_12585, partial [Solirubrobacteraceae bacterium]|nr:hypothetical protein [Solirubrobacteraceae bacterium]